MDSINPSEKIAESIIRFFGAYMEQVVSFKTRVKNSAIENARYFNELFVKYDYLIFTEAVESLCFEVKATEGNYLHLIGVSTPLTPVIFFQKCLDGSLQETDFSFNLEAEIRKLREELTRLEKGE